MRRVNRLAQGLVIALGVWPLAACAHRQTTSFPSGFPPVEPSPAPLPQPELASTVWPSPPEPPQAAMHTLTIPAGYPIQVTSPQTPQTVAEQATAADALAAINGGFFDPATGETASFITLEGKLAADPRSNRRLTTNPNLEPYLAQIFNRSELRDYRCDDGTRYDIATHQTPVPPGCILHSALGAGPQLLPRSTSEEEGFTAYREGVLIRDAINSQGRSARSAVGLRPNGDMLWVVATQTASAGGLTLNELAEFLRSQGVTQALNLDGGSSTSLSVASDLSGTAARVTYYGSLDASGNPIQRPVKSLLILPRALQPARQDSR